MLSPFSQFLRTIAIAVLFDGPYTAGADCLADAIPESNRKYIRDDAGNSLPIGVVVCNWQSSFLLGDMIKIFLEEVLGYHAQIDPTLCQVGSHPIFALGGCTNFDNDELRSCGQESKIHVGLDAWVGSYANEQETFAKDYPDLAAVDLGSMGYDGEESIYVSKAAIDSAYADVGLALDFYKSYNASVHNPSKYFDKMSDVNPMELTLCSENAFTSSTSRMNLYVQFSGDSDGMTQQADGSYVAKCPDGRWWPGPGCRNDLTKCIPVITYSGWKLQAIMQWVTAYNFPAAVAMSTTYANWTKHVASNEALHYWWVPDATFIERQPEPVIFPRHSPSNWALGDKKTGGKGSYVAKMVSSNLQTKAPGVREFVAGVTFELPEVMDILLEQKQSGASNSQTMCQWVQRNRDRWEGWVPDRTKCAAQFGLYREEDNVFVTNRLNREGITCRACPSGRFSAELTDSNGTTFFCKPCAAGTSQASGAALRCDPCAKGEYQDEEGQSSCKRCNQGQYQSFEGQKQCIACPNDTTTLGFSSKNLLDCGCRNHKINIAPEGSGLFDCLPCSDGLNCQFPSTIQNLMDGPEDQTFATIKSGYFSTKDDPTSLYRCEPASYCPGGKPGECTGGLTGVPCAICPVGQTWSDTKCVDCNGAAWAWPGVLVAMVAVFLSYYVGNAKVRPRATPMKLAAIASGLAVNVLQTIAIMGMMTAVWSTDMETTSSGLSFLILDIQSFGVACFVGSNPVNMFTATAVLIPLVVFWIILCKLLTHFLPRNLARFAWRWRGAFNISGILLQAGFSTMSAVALQPMMCYQHPNGVMSLLKYPNVVCGESEQSIMLGIAVGTGSIFIVAFYAVCCYGAIGLPKYTRVPAFTHSFRFLYSNFRQDRWWFGLLTMARGFSFALVIAVATDAPEAQSSLASLILVMYSFAQSMFWPWKVALVNMADMLLSALLLLLANRTSVKQIESIEDPTDWTFQRVFTLMILVAIGICLAILAICIFLALSLQLLGGDFKKCFSRIADLYTWDGGKMAVALKACSEGLLAIESDRLGSVLGAMNHYDLEAILAAITVFQNELIHEGTAGPISINSRLVLKSSMMLSDQVLDQVLSQREQASKNFKDENRTSTTTGASSAPSVDAVVPDENLVDEERRSVGIYLESGGNMISAEL